MFLYGALVRMAMMYVRVAVVALYDYFAGTRGEKCGGYNSAKKD
jgi:hypothetical protein